MEQLRIVPTAEEYVDGFHQVLGVVARERRYIGFVEPPPIDGIRAFVKALIAGAGIQLLAVTASATVVGWCDITPNPHEGFRHTGRLGMGLLPDYRGQGLGRRLVLDAVRAARAAGMERIELEVFASNTRAIRLYEAIGFVHEGVKRHARKLDGAYDDNVMMALLGEVRTRT
jgi:RimJ/RimL family protein N-acetyltransferase